MNESKFDRGAWLVLLLVCALFAWGAFGMLYFFAEPSDGWFATPPGGFGEIGLIYRQNLMDAPSGLQPNDHVIAIEGISRTGQDLTLLQERWQAGATLRYTIERGASRFDLAVPLVRWQFGPAVIFWVQQGGGFGLTGMLLFLAIAALAFFKRPEDHAARALFLFAALFPALVPLIQTSQSTPSFLVSPALTLLADSTIVAAYTVLFPPVLLQFALVFPRPKPIVKRHPRLQYLPYLIGLCVVPFFLLQLYLVGYAWTISSILGTILILIHSAFTTRDAASRAQLRWGVWGFVIGMTMFLSTYLVTFGGVTGVWAQVIDMIVSLSFSVLGITLAVAILRYRLFDIDLIIRRTLTYGLVTAVLGVIFFGSVILLQQLFSQLTGAGQNELVTVLSTLAIAALFVPLRNRVQSAIDRRFNRQKYDAQQVLTEFANTVRDETDLERLTARLMQVVDDTMQPKSVSVWLRKEEKR